MISKIRVLIAEQNTITREGLRSLLDEKRGIEIVGEVGSGHELDAQAAILKPQLVLSDILLPGLSVIQIAKNLHASSPFTKVVILTGLSDYGELIEAIRAGVRGYILLDSLDSGHLVDVLVRINDGEVFLSPGALLSVFNVLQTGSTDNAVVKSLTPRESEIIKMIGEGGRLKSIAADLGLSTKTIQAHKYNLMKKLGLHSQSQIMRYVFEKKICPLTMEGESE